MSRSLLSTLAAGVAVLGLAAPAQAALPSPSDPAFAVPEGKIEHAVVVQQVSGSNAIPSHERTESWLTRDRAHVVVTDLRTGRLRAETVATPTETRLYTAQDNAVRVLRHRRSRGLPYTSASFDAAVQKAYLEQGITRVVGEKVVGGRRALVTEPVAGRWRSDEHESRTTAVVDAETFALLERSTVHPRGLFSQTQTFSVELLDASAAGVRALRMRPHRGARIRRR